MDRSMRVHARPVIDVLVAGAGLAGATTAHRLAEAGCEVLVMERRDHLAGNAYDTYDAHGVLVHRYGPHIFHTADQVVWSFLQAFATWRTYQHRVLARHRGGLYPMPINRTTLERFFAITLPDAETAEHLLACERRHIKAEASCEDTVRNRCGDALYEAFYRHYTRKQWDRDPSELAPEIGRRLPVRTDRDDRYFTDPHQGLPIGGYTKLVTAMLDHPRIHIELSRPYRPMCHRRCARRIVYTGPLDAYYGHRFGPLPWRCQRFEFDHQPNRALQQPVAVINETDPQPAYLRTTEFRHLTGQDHPGTTLAREYPGAEGEPCYPVPNPANEALADRYRDLAQGESGVHFLGRLATYRYLNMDLVVRDALTLADHLVADIR